MTGTPSGKGLGRPWRWHHRQQRQLYPAQTSGLDALPAHPSNSGDTIGLHSEWADSWNDTATATTPTTYDGGWCFEPQTAMNPTPSSGHDARALQPGINIGPTSSGTKCNQSNTSDKNTPGPTRCKGSEWTAIKPTITWKFVLQARTLRSASRILVFDAQSLQVFSDAATQGQRLRPCPLAYPTEITAGAVFAGDLSLGILQSMGRCQTRHHRQTSAAS